MTAIEQQPIYTHVEKQCFDTMAAQTSEQRIEFAKKSEHAAYVLCTQVTWRKEIGDMLMYNIAMRYVNQYTAAKPALALFNDPDFLSHDPEFRECWDQILQKKLPPLPKTQEIKDFLASHQQSLTAKSASPFNSLTPKPESATETKALVETKSPTAKPAGSSQGPSCNIL